MRPRKLTCLLFPLAAVVIGWDGGDILAQYSFTDVVAGAPLNRDATTVAPNVTAGSITDAPIVFTHPIVAPRPNYRCRLRHATRSLRRPCALERKFYQRQCVLHIQRRGERRK